MQHGPQRGGVGLGVGLGGGARPAPAALAQPRDALHRDAADLCTRRGELEVIYISYSVSEATCARYQVLLIFKFFNKLYVFIQMNKRSCFQV